MRSRSFAIGSMTLLAAALLAACGGGGGSTPTPTPTNTPTPTPAPTLNPYGCVGSSPFAVVAPRRAAVNPPHPIASGDTFAYTGSLSTTFSEDAPCPQPTATSAATVTDNVTNYAASSFPGGAPTGATADQRSAETDAFPLQTTTTTTDLALSVSNPGNFDLYETKSSDTNGDTLATTYATAQVLDELPEAAGSWGPNDPQATFTETLADGTAVSRSIASDGSYTDTENYPDLGNAVITVNGKINGKSMDGSGTYNFDGGALVFSYAKPSGGNITLTLSSTGSATKTRTFPVWYTLPASYVTDNFQDMGPQAFDAKCNVGSEVTSIATTGNQIVETDTTVDPVIGYIETRTTTSYVVNGFGAVCVKIDDAINSFYEYNADTTKIDYQSPNGQPIATNHIVEYLGLQSTGSGGPYSSVRTHASTGISPVEVASRIAAIEHLREVQRAQHLEAIFKAHLLGGSL